MTMESDKMDNLIRCTMKRYVSMMYDEAAEHIREEVIVILENHLGKKSEELFECATVFERAHQSNITSW